MSVSDYRIETPPTLGRPDCAECHGSGYIGWKGSDHKGRPASGFKFCACIDGRVPTADDIAERDLHNALRHAGIADPKASLAREVLWGMAGREEMENGVRRFVERAAGGKPSGAVVLAGPFGIGKSVLGEYATIECVKAGVRALYVSKAAMSDAVQMRIEHDDKGYEFMSRVRHCAVVVFDQLDWVEDASPMTKEAVRDIFDGRYQRRAHQATLYVVNLAAWDAEKTGTLAPLYNRMLEAEIFRATFKGIRAEIGQSEVVV